MDNKVMTDDEFKNKQKAEQQATQIKKLEIKGDVKAYTKELTVQIISSTIMFVLGLIIVMSFAQPIFTGAFKWSTSAILFAIICYSIVAGRLEGIDWNLKRQHGLYKFTYDLYNQTVSSIANIQNFLDQWCDLLFERKRRQRMNQALSSNNINDPRVLDLDLIEIDELNGKRYRKDWLHDTKYGPSRFAEKYKNGDAGEPYVSYFDSLSAEQCEVVKRVMTGEIKINKLDGSYFTSATTGKNGDAYYNASGAKQEENKVSAVLIASRLIVFALSCILLGNLGFEIYKITEGEDNAAVIVQRLYDCFTRIFALVSGIAWGFNIGERVVGIRQFYLNYRIVELQQFKLEYDQKIFIPLSTQEKTKVEYEREQEFLKEKQKKIEEDNKNITILDGMPKKNVPLGIPEQPVITMGTISK